LPSVVKLSVSDAAAKTVIVPPDGLAPEPDELPDPLLEQPAAATAASAAARTVRRRTMNSLIRNVGTHPTLTQIRPKFTYSSANAAAGRR
jgi:hypothetical protein